MGLVPTGWGTAELAPLSTVVSTATHQERRGLGYNRTPEAVEIRYSDGDPGNDRNGSKAAMTGMGGKKAVVRIDPVRAPRRFRSANPYAVCTDAVNRARKGPH